MNKLLKPAIASAFAAFLLSGVAVAQTEPTASTEPADQALAAAQQTDDAAISESVRAALAADKTLAGAQIDVQSKGGEVSLSGTVGHPGDAEKAAAIAKGVPGVKGVKNELKSK